MKKQRIILDAATYLILGIVAIITLIPLAYTVLASFKSNMEIMTNPGGFFPKEFSFDNYITAWNSKVLNIGRMTTNSLIYTLFCMFFNVFTSCTAAYVFARGEFRGKKVIFAVFSALMFIQLGSITVYPLFEILKKINLNQSLYGLMVVKSFGIPVVHIYLVRSYIKTISPEIDEAAIIDGCSFIGVFFRIILPIIKPIVATVALLSFQGSWNEYLMPSIFTMTKPEQQTLIVGIMALKNSDGAATNWNLMLAGSAIALVPVLVAYVIANKHFVAGIAAGAVKG